MSSNYSIPLVTEILKDLKTRVTPGFRRMIEENQLFYFQSKQMKQFLKKSWKILILGNFRVQMEKPDFS